MDAGFKTDARPQEGQLEDHEQDLSLQRLPELLRVLLHLVCDIQQQLDTQGREIAQRNEVPLLQHPGFPPDSEDCGR
jgi:hypothetical protein